MRVVVLGAGRVGSAIARDLATLEGWQIKVVDISAAAVDAVASVCSVDAVHADMSRADEISRVVAGQDVAVAAVPGPMGCATVRAVVEAGVDVVDICFSAEDPFDLDELARQRGVRVLVDCGIAPGCDNIILGYLETVFERVDRFSCYVGGLPFARYWPYEYRSVFSPIDVIAEYTRPARLVENGRVVIRDALSERELVDFRRVGTLEAFNTDGLRTLLRTSKVPHMKEKTLRFPGHADLMRILRETGFFSEEPISIKGVDVRPLDLTARLLFPAWQLAEDEEDLTVMRIEVEGLLEGRYCRRRHELLDHFDRATGTTSMARTTGYTCTGVVRALAAGLYAEPGVSPPEYLGRTPGCYDFIIEHLAARGITFTIDEETMQR